MFVPIWPVTTLPSSRLAIHERTHPNLYPLAGDDRALTLLNLGCANSVVGQGGKRNPNPNFLVRIFSSGVGVFDVNGWGPKTSTRPSKPGKSNFLCGMSRDFARISRGRPKSLRKKVCVQFPFHISEVHRTLLFCSLELLGPGDLRSPESLSNLFLRDNCRLLQRHLNNAKGKVLGQKSCRTKVSRIFRIFVPDFLPNFPPNLPEFFKDFSCFVSWETETRKNSPKIPAIFQCKIPRQTRKKYSQNVSGE